MKHLPVSDREFTPEKSLIELTIEIGQQLGNVLKVPATFNKPDKLIAQALNLLKEKTPRHNNLQTFRRGGELDIKTTKPLAPRALLFMDTLISALRARGHEIELRNGTALMLI